MAFYSKEYWERVKRIESKYLRVCEYCKNFDNDKMKCKKTGKDVGLFSYCDDFAKSVENVHNDVHN